MERNGNCHVIIFQFWICSEEKYLQEPRHCERSARHCSGSVHVHHLESGRNQEWQGTRLKKLFDPSNMSWLGCPYLKEPSSYRDPGVCREGLLLVVSLCFYPSSFLGGRGLIVTVDIIELSYDPQGLPNNWKVWPAIEWHMDPWWQHFTFYMLVFGLFAFFAQNVKEAVKGLNVGEIWSMGFHNCFSSLLSPIWCACLSIRLSIPSLYVFLFFGLVWKERKVFSLAFISLALFQQSRTHSEQPKD